MKITLSLVLLTAALSVLAQRNSFDQSAPVFPVPAPGPATEPQTVNLLRGLVAQAGASSSPNSVPPLLLQFTSADPNALSHLEEDLSVMTRLLEKSLERSLGENSPAYKMGIPMLVTSSSRSVRAMYVEGFGAVFMIKVNFPVLAPPTAEEKKPERISEDSEWERTRKEVLGIQEPSDSAIAMRAHVPYDAALVKELKKALLETLRNASHIRGAKAEESVCVTVFGSPNVMFAKHMTGSLPGQPKAPAPARTPARVVTKAHPDVPGRAPYAENYSSRPAGQGTVLSLRVNKADVDAFANGKLDYKDFEKRTVFNTYLGSGHDITSVNSWSRPATSYGSGASGLRR